MNLVIVESPAKAKTIEGFLGKDYTVKSSYGHVRDLAKKGLSIDIEKSFEPNYEVLPDKKQVITELKKLAKTAELIWLATDEDREGEAISWHLYEVLGLNPDNTRRIVFNEITKAAITRAIENPRTINIDLVNAQQARRVLDRLVGFELSPVLWRKVKPSLSAGRVQSVTVRLIGEREKEIGAFKPVASFKTTAYFNAGGNTQVKAELSQRFATLQEAKDFANHCIDAQFTIKDLETKPSKKSPAAPFTTSTLQQEASRKLGFSVSQTMVVAQRLYEAGHITYMRTDSLNLSDLALDAARDEILESYGDKYSKTRKYNTKSKGAQEAHEAIRPAYMNKHTVDADRNEQRLYELIWKRTVASQMEDAQLEKTTVKIAVSGSDHIFVAKGEVIKFDGFLKVYMESSDDDLDEENSGMLPPLKTGQDLALNELNSLERFSHHPARYTEASLVRKLEELGIGRPSTYAPTISTVQKRGYVEKEDREGKEREYYVVTLKDGEVSDTKKTEIAGREKSKLFPTDIGIVVNDFLTDHFGRIMDYNFTASVEKEFDDIADGQMSWNSMIDSFYGPFHDNVEETLETSAKATGERLLGEEPGTGLPVYSRIGRFGPMIQIGDTEEEEKPRFASLLKNQSINTITLEEALDLFKLPRDLGEFEEKKVVVGIGRFGPYVRHNNKFVSIKKQDGDDPLTIDLERAVELIRIKREEEEKNHIHTFEKEDGEIVQVLNGRYGPYIKIGKKNFKIPKDVEPNDLTLEKCIEISENQPKPKRKTARKKS